MMGEAPMGARYKGQSVAECAQAAEPIVLWLSSSNCQLSCG